MVCNPGRIGTKSFALGRQKNVKNTSDNNDTDNYYYPYRKGKVIIEKLNKFYGTYLIEFRS